MNELNIYALNNFGRGKHPRATARNLHRFSEHYLGTCLERMLKARKHSVRGFKLIAEADAMIGWKE